MASDDNLTATFAWGRRELAKRKWWQISSETRREIARLKRTVRHGKR